MGRSATPGARPTPSGLGHLRCPRPAITGALSAAPLPSRDHFAACNGTALIEVSSGKRKIYRLSRRGNRRLNHAIHMAAVTQVSHLPIAAGVFDPAFSSCSGPRSPPCPCRVRASWRPSTPSCSNGSGCPAPHNKAHNGNRADRATPGGVPGDDEILRCRRFARGASPLVKALRCRAVVCQRRHDRAASLRYWRSPVTAAERP
jgi:hypothetical protein